jgi:micrococcal nuclease
MKTPVADKYTYDAKVIHVIDGDTIRCQADLGFGITCDTQNIRLARINAAEMKGTDAPKGAKAKEALTELLLNKDVIIQTKKNHKDRYGRYICEVWLKDDVKKDVKKDVKIVEANAVNAIDPKDNWININDWLLEKGYAKQYN